MFTLKPRKSPIAQLGDVLLAVIALPVMAVVWIANKAISTISDNV